MGGPAGAKTSVIYVSRGGMPTGPHTLLDAKQRLAEQSLKPDDLAWCEGLEEWVPLSNVLDFAEGRVVLQPVETPAAQVHMPLPEEVHPRGKKIRLRPTGKLASLLTWLEAPAKKERANSEKMGRGLWTFCRTTSREAHEFFVQALKDAKIELDETAEFTCTQEILMINLWLISVVLKADSRAVEVLHKHYFARQTEVAKTFNTDEEKVGYMAGARNTLLARFETYSSMWDTRSHYDQDVLATYMIEYMLGHSRPDPASINKSLVRQTIAYIHTMVKTITELRESFEIVEWS